MSKLNSKEVIFSIVIPTYNRAEKLRKCLASIQEQTFLNYEVLVCDDGSTDHTFQVVEAFNKAGLNIKYFFNENWGGPGHPRNIGIREASAEWVCFLDSDDRWYPDKLRVCAAFIAQSDFIYHDFDTETQTGKGRSIRSRALKKGAFENLLIKGNTVITSSVCVRKSLLQEMNGFIEDRDLIAMEDYDLWLRIARRKCRFKYIPEIMGSYWEGGENITAKDTTQINRINIVYERHLPFLNESAQRQAKKMRDYLSAKVYHMIPEYQNAILLYKRAITARSLYVKVRALFFLSKALLRKKI